MSSSVDTLAPIPVPDPLVVSQTIGKRKRSSEAETPATMEMKEEPALSEARRSKFNAVLDDFLVILKDCDTNPSILNFNIPPIDVTTPTAKRTKLDNNRDVDTVASRITSHAYLNIDELTEDLKAVVSAVSPNPTQDWSEQVKVFERTFRDIITRETILQPDSLLRPTTMTGQDIKEEDSDKKLDFSSDLLQGGQTVLTLHAGFPGGRQLFSSLKPHENIDPSLFSSASKKANVREAALPNGISTTTIIPTHSHNSERSSIKVQTLGELCPTPTSLPTLDPPKASSLTTTRGSTVAWYKPATFAPQKKRTGGRETYSNQFLSNGSWLSYNIPPTATAQSTGEKRKQRDRALSTGEPHPERSEEDMEKARISQEVHQQTRDTELFKSVYSSFAPSFDNSAAVVPQQLKSKLWWHKVGQYKHQDSLDSEDTSAFEDATGSSSLAEEAQEHDEMKEFQEAVDSFEERDSTALIQEANRKAFGLNQDGATQSQESEDKDINEILHEISDLLETLNSYQRVRNMSLATTTQTSAGQNKPLTALSGTPSSPSEAEVSIYHTLRDQLALMIGMLPPYAVSKLNSDQLGELNISTNIQVEDVSYKGLIQDEVPKPAAVPVNGIASTATRPQPTSAHRGAAYQPQLATPQRNNSYSTARPAATNYLPQNRAQPPPGAYGAYPQTAPQNRMAFAQNYGQQGTPTPAQHYANGPRAVTGQNGYNMPNLAAGPRPMPQPPRQNPASFQRPPSTPAYNSSYAVAGGRSSSPQNNNSSFTGHVNRMGYPTGGQGSPPRAPLNYINGVSASVGQSGGQSVLVGQVNTVGQALKLSADEQISLMQRNRGQIANLNATKPASGTPQPINGQPSSRPQSNGTPASPTSASPTPIRVNGMGEG